MKKLFRKIFKKKMKAVPPQVGGVAPVIRINDGKYVADSLGITDERAGEIILCLKKEIDETNDIVGTMERMHIHLKHQNEFAFIMYSMSDVIKMKMIADGMKEMFNPKN